jgi:hypothetical protein
VNRADIRVFRKRSIEDVNGGHVEKPGEFHPLTSRGLRAAENFGTCGMDSLFR